MAARFVLATPDIASIGELTGIGQNQSAITVSLWANIAALGTVQQLVYWTVNTAAGGSNSRIEVQLTTGGNVQVFARAPDSGGAVNVQSTGALSAGVTAHVAVVIDVAADEIRIYIDGVLDSTLAAAFASTAFDNTTTDLANAFGGNENLTQPTGGDLWDLCLFHRALSLAEIQTAYQTRGAIVPIDIVGRMRCNEGTAGSAIGATDLVDSSGPKVIGGSIAIANGAPTYQNDSQIQSALRRAG